MNLVGGLVAIKFLFSHESWVSFIIPIDEVHHFSEGWPWPTNQELSGSKKVIYPSEFLFRPQVGGFYDHGIMIIISVAVIGLQKAVIHMVTGVTTMWIIQGGAPPVMFVGL